MSKKKGIFARVFDHLMGVDKKARLQEELLLSIKAVRDKKIEERKKLLNEESDSSIPELD